MNGKSGTLVTTGHPQYVRSCQHMHSVAVPAEVQLCLDSALLSDTDAALGMKA